ncbi:ZIP family metal transporter [Candidatus Woesearchaeota archaeon]|nr:ZIP family metal transporter [Candidatus Woesearchaeota archaeon]
MAASSIIWIYSLVSVLIISLISFIGIIGLSIKIDKLKQIVLFLVSFSAGALLGDVFIHLLPELVEEYGFGLNMSLYVLSGIVFFFIVEKFIHWHHCHIEPSRDHPHPFALMNLLGDAVHNFIDGMIIAGSYLASLPVGIATTTAVILHEIPTEIGDFGVLLHGGFSKNKALAMNFLSAITAVLGAIVALLLSAYIPNLNKFLIPFTVGVFIYIAGSDLIPELHKEVNVQKSFIQLVTFVLGIVVMVLLLGIE